MPNYVLLIPSVLIVATFLIARVFRFGKPSRVSPELTALFCAAGASENVAGYLARSEKLKAIQAYHVEKNISLREAKYAIEQIMLAKTVPDALLAAGIPASVVTQIQQGNTIAAIKAYREEKNVSLREAKATVEQLMER